MTRRIRSIAVVAVVVLFAASAVAVGQPSVKTDGTGRAIGYWEAYEEAQSPYAPYTVSTTDGTGRAIGYWEAYEEAFGR